MEIIEIARKLRNSQTESEKCFWNRIRKKNFFNKRFLRQFPIKFSIDGKKRFFVADFYCSENKTVIEIDGKIHENQKEYDELRSYIIGILGMKVIRFKNDEIINNIEDVLIKLKEFMT